MIKQKILKIENKEFSLVKEQMKWPGEGTSNDPIVISTINETYTHIFFNDITNNITIKNLKDKTLGFKYCANIRIENCKITSLALIECKKMEISNNMISKVASLHSGDCSFKNNTFLRDSFDKLKKGYHNKRRLRNFIYYNSLFIYGLITFLYGLIIYPIAIFDMFLSSLIGLLMFLPLVLIFFPKPLFHIIRSRKYPPHQFENNNIIDQEQFNLSFAVQ